MQTEKTCNNNHAMDKVSLVIIVHVLNMNICFRAVTDGNLIVWDGSFFLCPFYRFCRKGCFCTIVNYSFCFYKNSSCALSTSKEKRFLLSNNWTVTGLKCKNLRHIVVD